MGSRNLFHPGQTKERDWEDTCQDFKERMTSLTAKLKTKENQVVLVNTRLELASVFIQSLTHPLCFVVIQHLCRYYSVYLVAIRLLYANDCNAQSLTSSSVFSYTTVHS